MNKEFETIYATLWQDAQDRPYWSAYPDLTAYTIARRAVMAALDNFHGPDVRDDAKLFLLINIQTIVVLPQLINALRVDDDGDPFGISPSRLQKQTIEDAKTVLNAARLEARDQEISSAAVIRGLAKVLDTLNLKNARIWSKSSEESY